MTPQFHTVEEIAKRIHREKRWLNEWLRDHPADENGLPFCLQVGRDRRLTAHDALRVIDAILTQEEAMREPEAGGVVYFIDGGDKIKIGYSRSLDRRLKQVQTSIPEASILLTVEGTFATEKIFHRSFAEHRLAGEWFRKAPDILDYIEQIRRMQDA